MTFDLTQSAPPFMKRSRAKLWVRTGLLAVFGVMFGVSLGRDLAAGTLTWLQGALVLCASLAAGYAMSRLVPMQVHTLTRHVTLSFDRIYFVLIWLLVIAKLAAGRWLGLPLGADLIMCTILGLMAGRLSGICVRVHALKLAHGLAAP